ncbi:MAG: YjfB family protein [Methylococcales bacterium]|jgi:hypothetical protein|nr:YjfB family protein [Methylococcales bacterium]MBT7443644.1 YjfB family protein [Methylococcales bacterium]
MNIGGVSSAVSSSVNAASANPKSSTGVSVLKKALDTQAAGAVALIDSIPKAVGSLGNNLNVTA